MSYFKITLIRSGIGMTKRQNAILASLGLRKRMSIVYHPVRGDIAGKIMKVKELLAVSECEKPETKQEVHLRKKPASGFVVEGRV
jgi:ribosomal protein L30